MKEAVKDYIDLIAKNLNVDKEVLYGLAKCIVMLSAPVKEEVILVANDESQQDWSDLRYKEIYEKAFIEGAEYMRTELEK